MWFSCVQVASLLAAWFLPTTLAFTAMQMSQHQPMNHRRTSSSRLGIPNPIPQTMSKLEASTNAVAFGCQEYAEQASLRSRVGQALGGLQRRIRRGRENVEVIEDVSDFDSILKSTKEQLVAVFFHSPVCKACQAVAPHYYKLSKKYPHVKFLSVPLTPGNKDTLQKNLGVKKFPFSHIYHSQLGLLDELPILRKLMPHFEQRLRSHVAAAFPGEASQEENLDMEFQEGILEEQCVK